MIQRIGACILVALFGVGCGVGDDPDDPDVLPPDPNPLKLVCSDSLRVTGTFVPDPAWPRPTVDENNDPFTGCWPIGTWNFTVALDPSDEAILDITGDDLPDRCGKVAGTQAATFEASYNIKVTRMPDPDQDYVDTFSVEGAVTQGEEVRWNNKLVYKVKVSEGGGGECEGGLELFSLDKMTHWNLHPALTGTTLSGVGDFRVYLEPQI